MEYYMALLMINFYIQMVQGMGASGRSNSGPLEADEKMISEDEIVYPMVLAGT